MSKRPIPSLSSVNPTTMVNLNRMTLLMSISEITPQICIAGQMAATLENVQKLGINYILNVAVESSPIVYPKSIKLEKYDIVDFPTAPISNFFHPLTDRIHAHLTASKQNKVLVHCMAGISRSTTIVCAYLVRYMNMSLRDAYLLCKKNRPICFPNLGFWNQLISYENQLRKENSVKMIQTQFGIVPDVAYEEIKQLRAQQQQNPLSVPVPAFPLATNNSTTNGSSSNVDSILVHSTRPAIREISMHSGTGIIRSRSLASHSNGRPSINASSTNINNSVYQTPLFSTNKQTFVGQNRIGRNAPANNSNANNNNSSNATIPPAVSGSSTSFTSNRTLPLNVKHRSNIHQRHQQNLHPSTVTVGAATADVHGNDRSTYETTYRASFFKPLVP